MKAIEYISVFACALVLVYTVWRVGSVVNYNITYKDMVQETIQEMVKKDSLKQ